MEAVLIPAFHSSPSVHPQAFQVSCLLRAAFQGAQLSANPGGISENCPSFHFWKSAGRKWPFHSNTGMLLYCLFFANHWMFTECVSVMNISDVISDKSMYSTCTLRFAPHNPGACGPWGGSRKFFHSINFPFPLQTLSHVAFFPYRSHPQYSSV